MNTGTRLAIFAAVVAVAVGGGALAGATIDPLYDQDDDTGQSEISGGHGEMSTSDGDEAPAEPAGLAIADGTLRLNAERTTFELGKPADWRFRILETSGDVVADFDPEQGGVEAHLIVASRDLAHFQHLHPTMAADGTWSIELTLSAPGAFRAFVDISVAGEAHTLGIDFDVPGNYTPRALPAPSTSAEVDGYDVEMDGTPVAGQESELMFTVTRNGDTVDLEPYLDAAGHLVILRTGDLAYLHTHPSPSDEAGRIPMDTTFPSPGSYRLFLQFQDAGVVHTAALTVEVP